MKNKWSLNKLGAQLVAPVRALVVVVVLLGLLVTPLALAEDPRDLKIGVLCPLTGKIAAYGQEQKNAVEMAIEEINAAGGILGHKLVMQLEDDEMKPELAASMTQKLINDEVDVIIGGMSSSSTMAGGPIANSKEILMISPWSTNPLAAEGDWVFRACFSDEFQGAIQAQYMVEGLGCQKPAQLLDVSDDGSKGQGEVVAATLEGLGAPFVTVESYGAGDRDFKAQLTKIKSMEPDCLDTPNYYGEVALIRVQMKELGLDIPHIGGDGVDSSDFFAIAGDAAKGMMITTHYSPEDPRPVVQEFRARYEEKYGKVPDSTAALSYDAVLLYKMAVETAGTIDKYAVREALAGLKDVTTLVTAPVFTMDEQGTGIKSLAIVEAGDDGAWHFKDVVNPPTVVDDAPRAEGELKGSLTFAGSTTVQPLAAKLGDAFKMLHPGVDAQIAAGGSEVGIQAVHDGMVDIGMASRQLSREEAENIAVHKIATDVIAVIVHESNSVESLTLEELRKIYSGEIVNWKEVGGPDQPMTVVIREESSGTRGAFDHIALGDIEPSSPGLKTAITAGDVAAITGKDPAGIGYVGFGNIEEGLKLLAIDGVLPSVEAVQNESYPLVRPLQFMTGPLSQPMAMNFIDFVLSSEGQQIVVDSGWVPTK